MVLAFKLALIQNRSFNFYNDPSKYRDMNKTYLYISMHGEKI